jgi:hypothetical protein
MGYRPDSFLHLQDKQRTNLPALSQAEAESAMRFPSPPTLAAVVLVISAGHLGKRRDAEALLIPRLKQERDVAIVRAHDALEEGRFEDADQVGAICLLCHCAVRAGA